MPEQPSNKSFFLQGGSTGVLLLHGFTATTFEVRALGDKLHAAGYTIFAPLLPGHGTSPDDLNRVKWEDWLDEAEKGWELLSGCCESIFVGGESMGGLLSLMLGHRLPEIKGILLFAPAAVNPKLFFTPLLKHFIKYSKKRNSDDIYEWQGYQVNPVAGAAELYALQVKSMQILRSITQPLLIFQGRNDQTVSPSGANKIYNRVSSTDKQIIWYDCGHCILLENDFDDAAGRSLEFIKRLA